MTHNHHYMHLNSTFWLLSQCFVSFPMILTPFNNGWHTATLSSISKQTMHGRHKNGTCKWERRLILSFDISVFSEQRSNTREWDGHSAQTHANHAPRLSQSRVVQTQPSLESKCKWIVVVPPFFMYLWNITYLFPFSGMQTRNAFDCCAMNHMIYGHSYILMARKQWHCSFPAQMKAVFRLNGMAYTVKYDDKRTIW